MHVSVYHLIATYGYVGLFVGLILEFLFIPVPGETVVMLSGAAWGRGTLDFWPLLVSVLLGTFVGSLIAYLIGRFLGRAVILRFARPLGVTEERLHIAEQKFEKYTLAVLLFSRFIPGVRVLIPYVAGVNSISLPVFALYSGFGSAVWCLVFLLVGRFLRKEWGQIHHALGDFTTVGIIVLVLAVLILLVYIYRRRRRQRDSDREQ